MPAATIDQYISQFPGEIQVILSCLRSLISEEAPDAKETMFYGIPTFELKGNLVHFAAFKKHIGFYPTPSGITAFEKELSGYDISTGTVRFPLGEPIPYGLIRKIVRFRVEENMKG